MTQNLLIEILLLLVVLFFVYLFVTVSMSDFTYLKSPIDNQTYMVQDIEDREKASEILSIIKQKINILRDHLLKSDNIKEYEPFRRYIKQFCERSKNVELYENIPDGKSTSYTVNKGDEIALCLRSFRT